ncbi:MAG TPA: hypothetical protein VFQ86_08130, partial [Arachidicoccus soli]|nr:hypothetical protein [Arachidicoccus soli]
MDILKRIYIILFVCLPFISTSQIHFYKKYSGGTFDQGYGITQLPDSNYAITGMSDGFSTSSSQAYLMLIDISGTQLWTKNYGGDGDDIGVRVVYKSGSGFYIAGYTGSTVDGNYDFALWKTDESGNLQWEKKYGGPNWEILKDARLLSDGSLILVGQVEGATTQQKDIYMVRVDAMGDTIWTKTMQTPLDDYASAVDTISATQFVVGGQIGNAGKVEGVLMAFNLDGTMAWSKFMDELGYAKISDVQVFSGYIYSTGSVYDSVAQKYDSYVGTNNLDGTFDDNGYDPYSTNTSFSALIVKDFNDMYVARVEHVPELSPYPVGNDAQILKYYGWNLLVYNNFSAGFSGPGDDIINQMIATNDGGIAFVGTCSNSAWQPPYGSDVMVVKIGANDDLVISSDSC